MSVLPPFQTATVGDGVQLSYIDSWHGKVKTELPVRYTTVVGLHGVGFNSSEHPAPLTPSPTAPHHGSS